MFSAGIERALRVTLEAHDGQLRKGGDSPYVVHPLHVALLLARMGADDDVIQAGLLHDVVEDSADWTSERLVEIFGLGVAQIVAEVTEDKSQTWTERKEYAIAHVPDLSPGALLVKACDKLHNLESLARALADASDPDSVWKRFRGGRERTLDTSERLVDALEMRVERALGRMLRRALEAIRTS
jgi:guanosine-3',5'-bis(diphosphate) 3'-pyrophosphohydrolase